MSSKKTPIADGENALASPSRGRASRDDITKRQRRRREGNDKSGIRRLAVPMDKLDLQNYVYRFVNETPGRIPLLHDDDWDLVEDSELGEGYTATRHADVAQNRLGLNTRLMRKPREWFEDDHADAQKRRDEEMKAAELGRTVLNGPEGDGVGLNANNPRVYSPNDPNKL